tara:strand:+ start:455 stop:1078 length:624 start_codon:yes stop_codon:yes gene_type:complete
MNKFYKLLFLMPIIIVGCKGSDISNKKFSQVFDKFDMNIYSTEGKKILTIKSPNSDFDGENNIFNLNKTTIFLFKGNIKEYKINSDNAKLTNNKLVELYGNVTVIALQEEENSLKANYFWWDINKSEYLLKDNVSYKNKTITLSSNKAIMNNSNNIIEFFKPVKYKITADNEQSIYEVKSENAYYNIDTKSLKFSSNDERVRSKLLF